MKRIELWQIYVTKNPAFEREGTVTLTTEGLRKLFEQTYDMGYKQGQADSQPRTTNTSNPVPDFFKGIF